MAARSRLSTLLVHGELRIDTNALVRSMSIDAKIALGLVCCCGFALAALLLLFYAGNPWVDHKAIPMFGSRLVDTMLFGAAGLICAFVTTRLIQFRRWALVDGIRGKPADTRFGNLCLLLSDPSKERFRSVGERFWNWHFDHFDNAQLRKHSNSAPPRCAAKIFGGQRPLSIGVTSVYHSPAV